MTPEEQLRTEVRQLHGERKTEAGGDKATLAWQRKETPKSVASSRNEEKAAASRRTPQGGHEGKKKAGAKSKMAT